ncbi:MAG TPA: hypothetical protein VI612_03555 [Candidatus Nanoarchaeia archaeon]|nr:hypothetical protein [Candidatus Nanoarchaeia archaeon]
MKTSITTLLVVAILALGVMGFVSVNDSSTGGLAIHPPDLRPGQAIRIPEHITPIEPRPEPIIPPRPHPIPPRPHPIIPVDYVYVDAYPEYYETPVYVVDPNAQWQICILAREFVTQGMQPSDYLKTLIATYCSTPPS